MFPTNKMTGRAALFAVIVAVLTIFPPGAGAFERHLTKPQQGFVDLHSVAPLIVIDIRYAGSHNFVGHPVPGYLAAKCLLTMDAAHALSDVQRELATSGLGLKVYDCYRPQRAVDFFVKWAADPSTQTMKSEFYPRVDKSVLIRDGYIASPSAHSRGSTVDLTIIPLPYDPIAYDPRKPLTACYAPATQRFADGSLDMGTAFDCFDKMAHTRAEGLSAQERANRMLLAVEMTRHGFEPYPGEWWHFHLKNEPYPDTYFDEPIE
jgi:zinc D-Ala-D-Ala dipeptidase